MTYLIILAVGLLLCAVGFWRYVYFFSVGYGFAVAGIGITLLILFHAVMTPVTWIACILFIVYGVRLGGYLMIREMKSAAYNKILKPENDRSKSIAPGVKIAIWVSCAILYFLQTSPFTFRLENTANLISEGAAMIAPDTAAAWIGLVLMIAGVLLEIAADMQKNVAKKRTHPALWIRDCTESSDVRTTWESFCSGPAYLSQAFHTCRGHFSGSSPF